MRNVLIILLFIINPLFLEAQNKLDSLYREVESRGKEIFYSKTYFLTNKRVGGAPPESKVYESQGMFHSTYIIFNQDSTFIYYNVFEVGFDLTFGKWLQLNGDTLSLTWNRQETLDIINDKMKYKKYFEYSMPSPIPMRNWVIRRTFDRIIPVK
jgi:hypothetical protein